MLLWKHQNSWSQSLDNKTFKDTELTLYLICIHEVAELNAMNLCAYMSGTCLPEGVPVVLR
jgi:hypothetical protein